MSSLAHLRISVPHVGGHYSWKLETKHVISLYYKAFKCIAERYMVRWTVEITFPCTVLSVRRVNCIPKCLMFLPQSCPCGETQTMFHIVESCPLTKLNGGLSRLHSADEDAVSWLTSHG